MRTCPNCGSTDLFIITRMRSHYLSHEGNRVVERMKGIKQNRQKIGLECGKCLHYWPFLKGGQ